MSNKIMNTVIVNAARVERNQFGGGVGVYYAPTEKLVQGKNPAVMTYSVDDMPSANFSIASLTMVKDAIENAVAAGWKEVRILTPNEIMIRISALIKRVNKGEKPSDFVDAMMSSSWAWMNDTKNGDPAWAPTLKGLADALVKAKGNVRINFELISELRHYELYVMAQGANGSIRMPVPDGILEDGAVIKLVSETIDNRTVSHADVEGVDVLCPGVFESGEHEVSMFEDVNGVKHYSVERSLPDKKFPKSRRHIENLRKLFDMSFDLLPHEEALGDDFKLVAM